MICRGCGGAVGRDCFSPQECESISRDMAERAERERFDAGFAEYERDLERQATAAADARLDVLTDSLSAGVSSSEPTKEAQQ